MAEGFHGIKDAIAETNAVLKRLQGEEFRQAVLPAARRFVDRAFQLAPYNEHRREHRKKSIREGVHLREALFIDTREHERNQTDILAGVDYRLAPHAHLQEFGWSKNPAGHPFLRPAAADVREEAQKDVADAVKKRVEKK
ncbi:MAG: hypothetical protein ACFFFC_19520 [Candidatus Thorarchaeota archaeon]